MSRPPRFGCPTNCAAICSLLTICSVLFSGNIRADEPVSADTIKFPGSRSEWNGFVRHDFLVDERKVLVVEPKRAAAGRPWVWHGEFFGHKPAPDIALLHRGFHIVYLEVPDLLGSPQAVAHWNRLYQELTEKYHLAHKAALVGLSRGGLYCYNWAIANPDKVACIYADAAVCDFKSWPGGKGKGKGSDRDWKLVMQCYEFSNEAEALAWPNNPVDRLEPLAKAGVPLLHVYGDADDVVPWDENTGLVADRYRKLGGSIQLIAKPGVGHHPHGLEDSTPIVEFIALHSIARNTVSDATGQTLRVLSYNIHHAEGVDGKLDVERIAQVISSVSPDIVSLQEVDNRVARTNSVSQPEELARLTGMSVAFGGNIKLQGGEYGNVVLSRYPVTMHRNHLLPCLDNGEQRGVLECEIQVAENQSVRFLATHLDHRRSPDERIASAGMICQLFGNTESLPAVLAGDLNDGPDSEPLRILGSAWTRTNGPALPTIPVDKPQRQIDFILVQPTDRWKILETRVLDEAIASDHRAILAILTLQARPASPRSE